MKFVAHLALTVGKSHIQLFVFVITLVNGGKEVDVSSK
jgi:hypothetical protein